MRLATAVEAQAKYGYSPGTLPPAGHRQPLPVLLDLRLLLCQGMLPGQQAAGAAGDAAAAGQAPSGCPGGWPEGQQPEPGPGSSAAEPRRPHQHYLCCCAGTLQACMRLTFEQLLQLSSGKVVDMAEGELPAQLQELPDSQASSRRASSSTAVEAAVAAVAAAKSRAVREAAGHGALAGEAAAGAAAGTGPAAPQPPGGGQGAPRFLLDGMLGRLCRWLRCLVSRAPRLATREHLLCRHLVAPGTPAPGLAALAQRYQLPRTPAPLPGSTTTTAPTTHLLQGIDAELVGSSPGRQALARVAGRAMHQGRIFLTRDYGLAQRRDGGAVFLLHSDEPVAQLGEVAAHFRIRCE